MPMTLSQLDAFLAQPLVAVLSTVDALGHPRSTPVWFHWSDGAAYVFTRRKSLKWRNLLARPHASLCVDLRTPPYSAVILNGPVEAIEDPGRLHSMVEAMAVALRSGERHPLRSPLPRQSRYSPVPPHSRARHLLGLWRGRVTRTSDDDE